MVIKLLSIMSYLCLTCKCCSFLVSPDKEICGVGGWNKLLQLQDWAFLLPMFLWKHLQGKRKDKAEEKSTRAGTGCSAWLCHGPATNVPLGLRRMAAAELAAAFCALLPSSSSHELQAWLRLRQEFLFSFSLPLGPCLDVVR